MNASNNALDFQTSGNRTESNLDKFANFAHSSLRSILNSIQLMHHGQIMTDLEKVERCKKCSDALSIKRWGLNITPSLGGFFYISF